VTGLLGVDSVLRSVRARLQPVHQLDRR